MKKLAIYTRADSSTDCYTQFTHPILKKYAEKCKADFIVERNSTPPFWTTDNKNFYTILSMIPLFDEYDRVLHLDSDMIISNDCPNLFEYVDEDKIGTIFEDKAPDFIIHRKNLMNQVQSEWGDVGWEKNYVNSGTFLVPKELKDVMSDHDGKYWLGWGAADVQHSYNIAKYDLPFQELPYQFNHMSVFSREWNGNANKYDSYIIHEAGGGAQAGKANSIRSSINTWSGMGKL